MKTRTILTVGWVVFLIYAYPGYLAPGVADQLIDARIGQFTDWHPVVLTEIWRIGWRLVDGPSVMLFIQSLLLLVGTYRLLNKVLVAHAAAYVAVAILWFPPVIASTSVIAPEPMLASLLVAGAAAVCSSTLRWQVTGLVLFALAGGIGAAALAAVLPLILAFLRRGLLRSFVAWVAVTIVAIGLPYALVDDRTHHPELERAMHDIEGTRRYVTTPTPDEVPKPSAGDQSDTVIAARDRFVRAHPRAYLHYRFRVWTEELGFTKAWHPFLENFIPAHVDGAQLSYLSTHSLAQRVLLAPVRWTSHTSLFRPHLYGVVALILLGYAVVRRRRNAAVILASGLAYELALVFTAVAPPQFFVSHWLVIATLLGAALLVVGELEPRDERVGEQAPLGITDDDRIPHG